MLDANTCLLFVASDWGTLILEGKGGAGRELNQHQAQGPGFGDTQWQECGRQNPPPHISARPPVRSGGDK